MEPTDKKTNNYIDNVEFYDKIKQYKETGVISRELANMLVILAEHNIKSSKYRRYSIHTKEDMLIDANISCIKALPKYDLTRKNPFAYFTTIVIHAFKYYLKKMYASNNLKLEITEDVYIRANKPFNNQIKRDMEETKKRKQDKQQKKNKRK